MNKGEEVPREQPERRRRQNMRAAVWTLAILSLALSLVGIAVLRLWIPGFILGIVALVLSVRASRSQRGASTFGQPHFLVSLLAVIVPVVILAVSLVGMIGRENSGTQPKELAVELVAQADGDFTVTHTVPAAPGADKATAETVDATDEFSVSFSSDLSSIQFNAAIVQSNLGTQEITCLIKIDGEVVLENTSDRRFVDCSTDLQTLGQ